MFVLIVEDDPEFVDELQHICDELPGTIDVLVARSRSSAFEALDSLFVDLIVLDLKLPTIDGALDAHPEHGHAVFERARQVTSGTPVFVLTGSPAENFISPMLAQQQQVDVWGQGKTGTIQFLRKSELDRFPDKLRPLAGAVKGLSDVELVRGVTPLTIQDDRLIRIFARRFRGTRCQVTPIGGGLSGAKVLRLRVTDSGGALVHDAVAKLGSPEDVRNEGDRFDNLVSRLDPAATPRKLATVEFGAGACAGIFYGLADGFTDSMFDIAAGEGGRVRSAVLNVEVATKRWREGCGETRRTIRDVRRRLLSDENLAAVLARFPLDWVTEFEANQIQTRWATIHGDLHGSNVLVSSPGSVVLIDYGDVGDGPASLDPITLELSLLFHPQRIDLAGWPSKEQARQWGSIDDYVGDCVVAEFLRACREWADRVSAAKREVLASAYSYLIRQLKYEDTNKELAVVLLEGLREAYEAT